jgi:hypothetical protein
VNWVLKIICPDGIDLKFLDESNIEYTVEAGALTVKNKQTKETLIHLEEGRWSNIIAVPGETFITT